ncbi:universal stress protein [Dissulfurispira sp.]|uniref:universal stress protein n=1 Tax=Dissulfurispira sp. TaxID=2817609 RepID=UPI003FA593DA
MCIKLLPTDGSELSEKAVKSGVALAKFLNAKVTGLYVIPKPTSGDIWDVWAPENTEEGRMFRTKFEASFECVARGISMRSRMLLKRQECPANVFM